MGYNGRKRSRPNHVAGNVEIFSYLGGDVVHYKIVGQGHAAARAINEKTLLQFLEGNQRRSSKNTTDPKDL